MSQNTGIISHLAAVAVAVVFGTLGLVGCTSSGGSQEEGGLEAHDFAEIAGREAVILDDDANRAFWGDVGAERPPRVKQWLDAMTRIGMSARTIASIDEWHDELLVLPHSY